MSARLCRTAVVHFEAYLLRCCVGGGRLFLSFVDPSLVRKHLGASGCGLGRGGRACLKYRAIPAGTPVFLDEETMLPIEPLCSWFRHLAYDDKDAKTHARVCLHRAAVRPFPSVPWTRSARRDRIGLHGVPGYANSAAGQAGWRCGVGQGSPAAQPALPMAGRTGPPTPPSAADDP